MLTPNDFAQALRPAFVVYALAMVSFGAAHRYAPAELGEARARVPAAARALAQAFAPAARVGEQRSPGHARADAPAWAGSGTLVPGAAATASAAWPCCPVAAVTLTAML